MKIIWVGLIKEHSGTSVTVKDSQNKNFRNKILVLILNTIFYRPKMFASNRHWTKTMDN